jgi:hypothetical protein
MVSKHDLIFQQWVASLAKRDRTKNAISGNFEDLFSQLKREGLVLESAYEYLDKAVKAHQPSANVIRNVYKKMKIAGTAQMAEKEFGEAWCKDVADKANEIFFETFPVEVKSEQDAEGPVLYGSMTAKEYKAQRDHAEKFPRLDTEELERRMRAAYDPMADLSAMLGTKSGSTK